MSHHLYPVAHGMIVVYYVTKNVLLYALIYVVRFVAYCAVQEQS